MPETSTECLAIMASNQPHLLCLPVTVPNSLPILPNFEPIESSNSVGNGPLPTRVLYALTIPRMKPKLFTEIPEPVDAALG